MGKLGPKGESGGGNVSSIEAWRHRGEPRRAIEQWRGSLDASRCTSLSCISCLLSQCSQATPTSGLSAIQIVMRVLCRLQHQQVAIVWRGDAFLAYACCLSSSSAKGIFESPSRCSFGRRDSCMFMEVVQSSVPISVGGWGLVQYDECSVGSVVCRAQNVECS